MSSKYILSVYRKSRKEEIIKIIYMHEYIIIYLYTSKEKVGQGQKKVFSGPHSDMTLFKIV